MNSTTCNGCIVLYCIALYCIVLFCFVLFCFVLFCFVLFCFVLFCFVLFCFVLFCFVLHSIVLVQIPTCPQDTTKGTVTKSCTNQRYNINKNNKYIKSHCRNTKYTRPHPLYIEVFLNCRSKGFSSMKYITFQII